MGLVNKVVPLEQLEDEYVQWAEEMMQLSPLALRMIKAGLNAELDGQSGIQELAGDATLLYYLTDEAQEGKNAFLEKRKPNFKQYPKFPDTRNGLQDRDYPPVAAFQAAGGGLPAGCIRPGKCGIFI